MSSNGLSAKPQTLPAIKTASQYQHFIPRFILRRYQVDPQQPSEETKGRGKKKGKKPQPSEVEAVLFYDLSTHILDTRPIGEIYGVRNLYQDIRSTKFLNELEEGLSRVENHASRVINGFYADRHYEGLHDFVTIKRKDLNHLRKFLFLMHYRRDKLSDTYFQQEDNRSILQWMDNFRKKHGLETSKELWLFALRYYLDTPHSQICRDAEEMYKKYGKLEIARMMESTMIDPDMEHYLALAYAKQANDYFLCLWEAAEGTEFFISDNSAGLWEGQAFGDMDVHRLFVISPRFAVVLRSNFMRPQTLPLFQSSIKTNFPDIEQLPPLPIYADRTKAKDSDTLSQHRTTPQADNDLFAFKITKLTKQEMEAFNRVTLLNARNNGSITFSSKEYMLHTIRAYCLAPAYIRDRPRYEPLFRVLSEPLIIDALPANIADTRPVAIKDTELDKLIVKLSTDDMAFRSKFDRAMFVFQMMKRVYPGLQSTKIASACAERTQIAIMRYLQRAPFFDMRPPVRDFPMSVSPRRSEQLFMAFAPFMKSLGIPKPARGLLNEFKEEIVIIHFLAWSMSDKAHFDNVRKSSAALTAALAAPFLDDDKDEVVVEQKEAVAKDELDEEDTEPGTDAGLIDTEIELPLDNTGIKLAIQVILGDSSNFPSRYDKARAAFSIFLQSLDAEGTYPSHCRDLSTFLINYFISSPTNESESESSPGPSIEIPSNLLVHSLSDADSVQLFSMLQNFVLQELKIEIPDDSEDIHGLLTDVALLQVLSWLLVNRPEVVKKSLPGMPLVQITEPQATTPRSSIPRGYGLIIWSCVVVLISLLYGTHLLRGVR